MKKENSKYNSGFKAPNKYFENFESEIIAKIEMIEFSKNSGFQVPHGYFKSLDDTIISKLSNSTPHSKIRSLFQLRTIKYSIGIAASIALLISLNLYDIAGNNSLSNIDAESISKYIDEGNLVIEDSDVEFFLRDDEIAKLQLENKPFSNDAVEDYLLDNLDDQTLLIE